MVRYLEQDEQRLYRELVRELRWQRINTWLGTNVSFEGLASIPWWTCLILLWMITELFRNS